MSDEDNGWSNYESWLVGAWLTGADEHIYRFWQERAAAHREAAPDAHQVQDGIWTPEQAARFALADELKGSIQEAAQDALPDAALFTDLLGAALSRVDWHEVAEHLLEE
jgi:hypothetical protein